MSDAASPFRAALEALVAADAERFRVAGVEVAVGRLEKLLRSKEASGREKDREFLRLFAARLRDEADGDR